MMKIAVWISVVALLLQISPLHAQTITEISGTISHGNSVIVRGTSFGDKPIPAAPVVWDNMETGSFSPNGRAPTLWPSELNPGMPTHIMPGQ